jgi:hypothetical protein
MLRYQFQFDDKVPFDEIDGTLMLATLAAECLHGRTRIQLDARFEASRKDNSCWIDGDTVVGQTIARIFTGLMVRLYGEKAIKVERVVGDCPKAA